MRPGLQLMLGYWRTRRPRARCWIPRAWLHTGDLAILDPDGPVCILGRKDDVINRGGFKIHPGPLEMTLRSHPGVKEAAVVGIPDAIYGELLCACIVPAPADRLR